MTDEQINRTIAESLEPMPETLSLHTLKYWWWEEGGDGPDNDKIWPKDFINDVAMRDLLQAKLLEDCVAVSICKLGDEYKLRLSRRVGGKIVRFDFYDTRERIWPLAFCRAHNLGDSK
jgi:hypothetical protein